MLNVIVVSAPSYHHHTKGEATYSYRTSTNIVNEQPLVGTPCESSSRMVSREAVLGSESARPQQMQFVPSQATQSRELGMHLVSVSQFSS